MKNDKALYLVVGLVVMVTFIILVFGVLFLNDKDPRDKFHPYFFSFTQVSTLASDDPVKVNGVKLGKVEAIRLTGKRVVVQVRVRDDVKIDRDAIVKVQNIGLMGERQVGILLGESKEYYKPGDTIIGHFDAGIAEAMGLAGEVFDSTRVLIQVVRKVIDSTLATDQFRQRFHRILEKAEILEDRVSILLDETDPALKRTLAGVHEATVKVNELLDSNRAPIEQLLGDARGLTTDARALILTLDTMTNRLVVITDKLQSKDNTLGVLLNDRNIYDDITGTLISADSLLKTIIKDGLDVNIDIF